LSAACEAARSLAFAGYAAPIIADVVVAELWRLMKRLDDIRRYSVVIAVAGMEGVLWAVR
jgi:pyridinium-3,5-biscarboxylic acid mononucleotide synthase